MNEWMNELIYIINPKGIKKFQGVLQNINLIG